MLTMILTELRHRRARVAVVVVGLALATGAFTVLTGASKTSRLEAKGEVARQFRTAYDILVRPRGSSGALERRRGLVQATFLSGQFGGITLRQYRRIADVPGVAVAAPLAIYGYLVPTVEVSIPVPAGPGRHVYRTSIRWSLDRGLSKLSEPDSYTYVTSRPLDLLPIGYAESRVGATSFEKLADGRSVPVCPYVVSPEDADGPFAPSVRARLWCWSTRTGRDGFADLPDSRPARVGATVRFAFPMLVAGIDPDAERRLSGLPATVRSGRFLTSRDAPRRGHGRYAREQVPVVASTVPPADADAHVALGRLPAAAAARFPTYGNHPEALQAMLGRAPATPQWRGTITAATAYRDLLRQLRSDQTGASWLSALWTAGSVRYARGPDGVLRARPAPSQDEEWTDAFAFGGGGGWLNPPIAAADVPFRAIDEHLFDHSLNHPQPALSLVGTFDPAATAARPRAVLDPFMTPRATGADARSRALLGDRDLGADGDPAGYLTPPPTLLTTLASRSVLMNDTYIDGGSERAAAPLSVIRVRVRGVDGPDAVSRERIRLVADRIRKATGLDVDITAGASPTTVAVDLPAGRHGRPALKLAEPWVQKGVAVAVLRAVDRKSVLLFGLVLSVCVLFCFSAVSAAVRQRTGELAILSCVGWPRRKLFMLLLGDAAATGLLGGAFGLAAAVPVGAAAHLDVSAGRALLAVPAATAVAVLAALWPAARAAGTHPLDAVRPSVRPPRGHARAARTLVAVAWANARRVPSRALLGAASLAVGVFALTVLLAVTLAFRGAVVGTVLGDAVTIQVRGIDYASVIVTLVLGVVSLADVLYINIRERSSEIASLKATGWTDRAVMTVLALEGTFVGVAGGLTGAGLGLVAARLLTDSHTGALVGPALLAAAAGAACAVVASILPTIATRRLPLARLLAEE